MRHKGLKNTTAADRAQARFLTLTVDDRHLSAGQEGGQLELLPFLIDALHISRTAAKSLLTHRLVYVDNRIETLHNTPLRKGNVVKISREKNRKEFSSRWLEIIYEDAYLIVVHKQNGLLSIATDPKRNERTAYSILSEYVKKSNRQARIFIVHRLDRETSGLMVFAKDERTKFTLQDHWHEIVRDRRYVAVIEGRIDPPQGCIASWLKDNKVYITYSSPTDNGGNYSVTHYRTLQVGTKYSLIELKLETGRKNQIRVHMQDKHTPVAGDLKYGSGNNPIGRLALHAYRLDFVHPVTGEMMRFSLPIPPAFKDLVKDKTETPAPNTQK